MVGQRQPWSATALTCLALLCPIALAGAPALVADAVCAAATATPSKPRVAQITIRRAGSLPA